MRGGGHRAASRATRIDHAGLPFPSALACHPLAPEYDGLLPLTATMVDRILAARPARWSPPSHLHAVATPPAAECSSGPSPLVGAFACLWLVEGPRSGRGGEHRRRARAPRRVGRRPQHVAHGRGADDDGAAAVVLRGPEAAGPAVVQAGGAQPIVAGRTRALRPVGEPHPGAERPSTSSKETDVGLNLTHYRLLPGLAILDSLCLPKRFHCLFDRHEHGRLHGGKGPAPCDREDDRRHRDIVR
jgi:hypothetical protein